MPKSLRCKIKHLCYNGTLTEKERDRILKALEQQPSEDCISREAALDIINHILNFNGFNSDELLCLAYYRINELPSVTPERPKGKWIDVNGDKSLFECSKCGDKVCCANNNYCPNCGAEMEVGE